MFGTAFFFCSEKAGNLGIPARSFLCFAPLLLGWALLREPRLPQALRPKSVSTRRFWLVGFGSGDLPMELQAPGVFTNLELAVWIG